jgi:hypothetical protein
MYRNTFPPLVSGSSSDFLGRRQILGKEILDSLVIRSSSTDKFFNPTNGLTGFAWDGLKYNAGILVSGEMASWATEPSGTERGPDREFPKEALVLVTDASLSILDINKDLQTWMISLRLDQGAFCHNFNDSLSGFTPASLWYGGGALLLNLIPDPGNPIKTTAVLVVDFVKDQVRLEITNEEVPSTPPNILTGRLGNELAWLKRQSQPVTGLYGQVRRQGDRTTLLGAHGSWELFGYVSEPNPVLNFNSTLYNESFSGECFGSIGNFKPDDIPSFQIKGSIINPDGSITPQGDPITVNPDGTWGPLPMEIGIKLVEITEIYQGKVLGNSLSSQSWDSQYELKHYFSEDPQLKGELLLSSPVYISGEWDLNSIPNVPVEMGFWTSELVSKSTGLIVAKTNFGLVQSWKVQEGDPFQNQTNLRDQALVLMASVASGDIAWINSLAMGLINTQNVDGSWNAQFNTLNGLPLRDSHISTEWLAMACYALLWTAPSLGVEIQPLAETAALNGLASLNTYLNPTSGLYLDGFGRFTSNGSYLAEMQTQSSLTTQTWVYNALVLSSSLVPQNLVLANALQTNIEGLWLGTKYAFGLGQDGLILTEDAKSRIMSGFLCMATGNPDRFSQIFDGIHNYKTNESFSEGFTNFLQDEVINSVRPLWPTLSSMAMALSTRHPHALGQWELLADYAIELRDYDFGWKGGYLYGTDGPWSTNPSIEATAWAVIGHHQMLKGNILRVV